MQAICFTSAFLRAAEEAGMTDSEIDDLVDYLARHPQAGDEMAGTGGCRKVRVAGRGKGKSGGYRTITFYTGADMPVFLITVFGKGQRANLSKAERNALTAMTKVLVTEYRRKIVRVGEKP